MLYFDEILLFSTILLMKHFSEWLFLCEFMLEYSVNYKVRMCFYRRI